MLILCQFPVPVRDESSKYTKQNNGWECPYLKSIASSCQTQGIFFKLYWKTMRIFCITVFLRNCNLPMYMDFENLNPPQSSRIS